VQTIHFCHWYVTSQCKHKIYICTVFPVTVIIMTHRSKYLHKLVKMVKTEHKKIQ
jgi:hypothetical protein